MRTSLGLAIIAALVAPAGLAAAQPTPGTAPTSSAQIRAEALMAAGKARVEAKDFAGALALFNDAYREYPDPKYFIAIGVFAYECHIRATPTARCPGRSALPRSRD